MDIPNIEEKCDEVAAFLKSLSHPQRLMIACHLSAGEKTVSELLALCHISQSQLSQFLKRMELEGLVDSRREGQYSHYRIKDKRLLQLLNTMQKLFC